MSERTRRRHVAPVANLLKYPHFLYQRRRAAEVRVSFVSNEGGLTLHARLPRVARGGVLSRSLRRRRGLNQGRRPRARPTRLRRASRGCVRYEWPTCGGRAPSPRPVLPDPDARSSRAGCFLHVRHRPRRGVFRPHRVRARGRHAARRQARHPPQEYHPKDHRHRGVERGRLRRVSRRRPIADDDRRRVRGRAVSSTAAPGERAVRHRRRRRAVDRRATQLARPRSFQWKPAAT